MQGGLLPQQRRLQTLCGRHRDCCNSVGAASRARRPRRLAAPAASARAPAEDGGEAGTSSSGSSGGSGRRSPVLILPGFLSNATRAERSQYREMAGNLLALGHPEVEVLQASTLDWLPTLSGGSFRWFVERLAGEARRLAAKHGGQVSLVGVSAGGWLARLALGSWPYDGQVWGLAPLVHTLVTCGTPHQSLERYPFGRAEEAWIPARAEQQGLSLPPSVTTSLQFANHHYPDAASLAPTRLVCVAGSAARGEQFDPLLVGRQVLSGALLLREARERWFVGASYVANCGSAEADGDGVCPVETALVPGAETLVLPGVWHDAAPGRQWYGSEEVVRQWDRLLP